ncbi:hypothetical protein BC832DRAFT_101014 [Gaertneriomyces semiglobifer]|nr:hypothetical protein BC832DRAFT_101014 [Gaertneriomyces semiglobifer]
MNEEQPLINSHQLGTPLDDANSDRFSERLFGLAIVGLTFVPAFMNICLCYHVLLGVEPVSLPLASSILTLATWGVYIWDLHKRRDLRLRLAAYAIPILASAVAFVAWQVSSDAVGHVMWTACFCILTACQVSVSCASDDCERKLYMVAAGTRDVCSLKVNHWPHA